MLKAGAGLLITSFNKAVVDYALARLEVALANPAAPAPPVVDRLGPSLRLDAEFNAKWPHALAQVGAAADFVASGNRRAIGVKHDRAWARLARSVRMIAQFAQSIEWVGVEPRRRAAGEESV